MQETFSGLGRLGWPVALLAGLVMVPATLLPMNVVVVPVLMVLAVAGFAIGVVWLARRIGTHDPFKRPDRIGMALLITAVLIGVGAVLPRSFYQWWRFENDTATPEWALTAGFALAALIAWALLLTLVWLAWALLAHYRGSPDRVEMTGAFVLALGAWLFALGWIVYRTDYTSEDILFFTMPAGLGATLSGGMLVIGSEIARRWRIPAKDPHQTP